MSGHAGHTPDDLPRAIGRYRIEARLDHGPIDDMYRGFDPNIERPVVVKVFRPNEFGPAPESAIKQAFYQEMQRAGLLMHHGIAALFDAGEHAGQLFMATEFVDGESVADRIAHGVTWDVQGRASILIQMLDALNFACDLGVPHLNLKPSKIVIGPGHAVKIGGFGAGAFVSRLASLTSAPIARSSYAAPEHELADARADVYSAALIARDLLEAADSMPPQYLIDHGVDFQQLQEILAKASAPSQGDRFSTPEAFKLELLLALGVPDSHFWLDPHEAATAAAADPEAETKAILTPSGVYVLPDSAATILSQPDAPSDPDAPTMMQGPKKNPS